MSCMTSASDWITWKMCLERIMRMSSASNSTTLYWNLGTGDSSKKSTRNVDETTLWSYTFTQIKETVHNANSKDLFCPTYERSTLISMCTASISTSKAMPLTLSNVDIRFILHPSSSSTRSLTPDSSIKMNFKPLLIIQLPLQHNPRQKRSNHENAALDFFKYPLILPCSSRIPFLLLRLRLVGLWSLFRNGQTSLFIRRSRLVGKYSTPIFTTFSRNLLESRSSLPAHCPRYCDPFFPGHFIPYLQAGKAVFRMVGGNSFSGSSCNQRHLPVPQQPSPI